MLDNKYFGKEVILKKSIHAQLVIIDISRDYNPTESFPVEIKAGETIIISGPIVEEFNSRKTNYYPKNGILFNVKGVFLIPPTPGSRRNEQLTYEFDSPSWFEILN